MPRKLQHKPCSQCGNPVTPTRRHDRKAFWYPRRCDTCMATHPFTPTGLRRKQQAMHHVRAHYDNTLPLGSRRLRRTDGSRVYWRIKVTPTGPWVYEHRHIMAQQLGRPLLTNEHVHHLNHDTLDNRPENLVLLSASAHATHHLLPYLFRPIGQWAKQYTACIDCGTTERPHSSHGRCRSCRYTAERGAFRRT